MVRGRKHYSILSALQYRLYVFFFIHSDCFSFPQTVDGMILEKPVDKHDAYRMLSRLVWCTELTSDTENRPRSCLQLLSSLFFSSSLSGKEHSVFTGVAIVLCHEKESKSQLNNGSTYSLFSVEIWWSELVRTVKPFQVLFYFLFLKCPARIRVRVNYTVM